LFENREPIIGIVYDPYRGEIFSAKKGEGCFLNGKRVFVSKADRMDQSLVAIGTSPYYKEMAEENFAVFQKIFKDCLDVRRSGSAAIDLAHVACGRTDCYLERRLKIWDYAAGMLLVREAGGKVTDYQGNDSTDEGVADILAGNAFIPDLIRVKYL
jgi:myo-inositol-1(or 4)-monophosphatase